MSHSKDVYYWGQLRAALTAGSWDATYPGKAPNGASLSWSELLRKFNKHCTGFADVAELASQTQALSVLLAANAKDQTLDGNDVSSEAPLALGDECVLSPERIEEGSLGYATLQSLRSSGTDPVRLAIAYYAYSFGHISECLEILEQVKDLADVQERLKSLSSMGSSAPTTLQVPGGTDQSSSSSSWTGSFASATSPTSPDILDGKAWAMTECIRSICLKGMCHEKIAPQDYQTALSTYLSAIPLIQSIITDTQGSISASSSTSSITHVSTTGPFNRYRELWRWVERLLRRAIISAARICDPGQAAKMDGSWWTLLAQYRACSAYWPLTFRPEHRCTIATLHLHGFIHRARSLPSGTTTEKLPRWISSARSVLQELRLMLNVCTHFPRAGERNVRVEDFVDLAVAIWEADGAVGEHAGWVIDFLWWATRLTFNSFRIYRHMTRLLWVSGDAELAKRTLRLYIQIVSKVQETASAPSAPGKGGAGFGIGVEFDTDRQWVETLVQGSRMLCRMALRETEYRDAIELAREAGGTIEKAKLRLDVEDKELVASVQLAEGTWHSVMAYTEQDPRTRTMRLSESIASFAASVESHPTGSAYHHLALALSRPGSSRDIHAATQHARAAVEVDPSEIRHWHLLGLLLAATEDWAAARSVLDIGIATAEGDLGEDEGDGQGAGDAATAALNGKINIKDFALSEGSSKTSSLEIPSEKTNGHARTTSTDTARPTVETRATEGLISGDAMDIPPSATCLQSVEDRPSLSRQERFEHALQIRMTQLALAEFVEGGEGVGEKWLEVFHWFREKRPATMDDRRKSIDSRRVSQDTKRSEVTSLRTSHPTLTANIPRPRSAASDSRSESLTAIPINIIPASPGLQSPSNAQLQSPVQENGERGSMSLDEKGGDTSRGKKVKDALKDRVHKGQARITTISKKIGHGVGRHSSLNLKRTNSTPDFHSVLSHNPYQASSIHLRQYQSIHASQHNLLLETPPPPPSTTPDPDSSQGPPRSRNDRSARDRRLLSDLWLMTAAIFRRLGKIEQARGAIQEAEVRDEDNPAVWVQLGLYYVALGNERRALEALQKALFIRPNDAAATIHLCRIYLSSNPDAENVDLAAGLLSELTRGVGWDVPEAWYFLARAYKLQGRRDRERQCLNFALTLSETRGVRDMAVAVGWCL